MSGERHHGGWVILLSFLCALILAIIPLPNWATVWRPDWVAMVLVYWCLAAPQRVGVITGWSIGILQDVLSDTLLGQHALSLCIIAYISIRLHRRVRLFPVWQQAVGVGVLVAGSQALGVWIRGILGHPPLGWSFIYPAFSSMILWSWVFVILRDMRRTYQVF